MATDERDPTPGTREHFLQVTQLQRWGTIQEYVDLCRTGGYFTPAFYRKATAHMERIHVRCMLRQVIDGRGWPVLANIVRVDPDGRPERVFMQEGLFGPEEYRQVVAYHYRMARHHLFKAQTYRPVMTGGESWAMDVSTEPQTPEEEAALRALAVTHQRRHR
jgi:hypothetical protein